MASTSFWAAIMVIVVVAAFHAGEWWERVKVRDVVEDPLDLRIKTASSSSSSLLRGDTTTKNTTTFSKDEAMNPVLIENGVVKVQARAHNETDKSHKNRPKTEKQSKNRSNKKKVKKSQNSTMKEDEKPKQSSKNTLPALKENTRAKTPEESMIDFFSSQKCHVSKNKTAEPWLKQMVIQIGVQKGGTKAMHTFLEEHPHFVSRCANEHATFELNYFNFNLTNARQKMDRDQYALQKGYEQLIEESCPLAVQDLTKHKHMLYMDDSPLYMQDSDSIPQLLNCAMPQSKILAIVRNPVDRAFSHFNFYLERGLCTKRSFDEWVDLNIRDLEKDGVLKARDDPYEELLAWHQYNARIDRYCRTIVSRGLYAIQLLHYKTALKAAGRSSDELMVVHSSDMKGENRQAIYGDILDFLGLEPHILQRKAIVHKTVYTREMLPSTRKKLEEFFKPYNHRLYEMLDWKDYSWD